MNSPHTPKLVPWLARKAGISDDLAARLWREAVRRAEADGHQRDTPKGAAAAMGHLRRLIAAESLREDRATLGARPWHRLQLRLLDLQLAWLEAGSVISVRAMRGLFRRPSACGL